MDLIKNRFYKMIGSIVLILCVLSVVGCGLTATQRKHTANFSKATTALAEVTSNELVQMRDGTIQMNTYRLAVIGTDTELSGPINLDEGFDIKTVKVRVQAVEALKTYGDLLQSLVGETQEKELKKASDRFVASINGLPGDQKKMTDVQTEALGQAVYKIGRVIVEAKKAKAVRGIVDSTQGQIQHLCNLLSNDFSAREGRLLTQYKKAAGDTITAIHQILITPGHHKDFTDLELIEMHKKAQANRDRAELIAENMSKAVGNLNKANNALNKCLKKQALSVTDIKKLKEYQDSVKEVIDFIKVLRKVKQ